MHTWGTAPVPSVAVGDLRGRNAAVVLSTVRQAAGPSKIADLAQATGLSRPTIEAIVEDLRSVGLLTELPPVSTIGRPARSFVFDPHAAYVVAVDVRASSVAAAAIDLNGQFVAIKRKQVRPGVRGKARAVTVLAVVHSVLLDAGIDAEDVIAITVGTPGWVEDNSTIRYVDNLRDWADVDITATLREEFQCAVAIENDANLAAVGEHSQGVGQGVADLVFILLGERVGAGIIAGGRPLHGHHGAAGEIGFMVHPTGSALMAHAIGEDGEARPGLNPSDFFSPADIVHDAGDNDSDALRALESVGTRLAQALAPTLLALDPAIVVLGTSLFGDNDDGVAHERVLEAAERESRLLLVDPPRWRVSSLGDDVILAGAARFSLSAVEAVLASEPLTLFH